MNCYTVPEPPPTMLTRPLDGASILLDLDGTLINSQKAILDSLFHSMRAVGQEPDPQGDYRWVIGPPLHDVVGAILDPFTPERAESAITAYRAHYATLGMLASPLFEGIEALLDRLRAQGAKLYLATSKPLHMARPILAAHGLLDRFAATYGARPDDSGAEKPELIGELIAREGVDPARAVMVGDRRFDISGAHANRLRAIGVLWGFGGLDELEQAGAEAIVADPEALYDAIVEQISAAARHDGRHGTPARQTTLSQPSG